MTNATAKHQTNEPAVLQTIGSLVFAVGLFGYMGHKVWDSVFPPQPGSVTAAEQRANLVSNYCGSVDGYGMAREEVEHALFAPSTAKISAMYQSKVDHDHDNPCRMTVTGYVDAQNAFGAMLRQNWTVTLEVTGHTDAGTQYKSEGASLY